MNSVRFAKLTIPYREFMFYGMVGSFAFSTHLLSVFLLVQFLHIHPLIANLGAFILSFQVSFLGHHYLTFSGHENRLIQSMLRLLIIATANFVLNECFYSILLYRFHLNYLLALTINLIVLACSTFLWAKFWAFKVR